MATAIPKGDGFLMRWTVKDPLTGKLSKRSRMWNGQGGKRSAIAEANRIEAMERDKPTATEGRKTTLRDYINDKWLPHARATTSITTANTNAERIKKVLSYIGDKPLSGVTGEVIDGMTAKMLADGVGDLMRRHYYDVLRTSLRQARKWKLISGEPWMDATRPKAVKRRVKVASMDDSQALADHFRTAGKPIAATYVETIADSGARPAEILALMWDAVDLDAGVVDIWRAQEKVTKNHYRIKETPKNESSVRRIALSDKTIASLQALKAHHAEMHLKSGGVWPKDGLVFPSQTAQLWTVRQAAQVIKRMADKHGLTTGSYSRRHGMASEMLASSEIPATVISERMGHANTRQTLTTYAHALPQHANAAVDWLNKRG